MTKSHQPPKLGSMMPQALLNPECLIGSSVRVLRAVANVHFWICQVIESLAKPQKRSQFLVHMVGLTISGLTGQMWQRLQGER